MHFDLPGNQITEQWWGGVRMSSQVASLAAGIGAGSDTAATEKVRYWPAAKCWTLQPMQESLAAFQSALPVGLNADDVVVAPGTTDLMNPANTSVLYARILEQAVFSRPGGLPAVGGIYRPHVLEQNDTFFVKGTPAFGDFSGRIVSYPPAPQESAVPGLLGAPRVGITDAPMDTVFNPSVTFPADQGFYIRWIVPGTPLFSADHILNFHFGQYCLCIGGSGQASLWEWCRPYGGGVYRWSYRKTFYYCRPANVANTSHSMLIFPMRGINGEKFIMFRGNQTDTMPLTRGEQFIGGQDVAYKAEPLIRQNDIDESPPYVTKEGPVRLDVRRDLKLGWQVMKLYFWKQGVIIDSARKLPRFYTPRPMNVRSFYRIPEKPGPVWTDPGVTVGLFSHADSSPIDPSAPVTSHPYATITLTGTTPVADTTRTASPVTPFFYGYKMWQESVITETETEPFTLPIDSLSVQSHCPDPRQDKGNVQIHDLGDQFPRLRNRGYLDCKITTTVRVRTVGVPGDYEEGIVTLFRGSCVRPERQRISGEDRTQGGIAGGSSRLWPNAEASAYSCILQGMASRLQEVSVIRIPDNHFREDETAPLEPGAGGVMIRPPWRVTDTIKYRLKQCGFTDAEIEIPDNPIRLWAGPTYQDEQTYQSGGDQIAKIASDAMLYLGAWVVWDNNAGALTGPGRPDEGSPEGAWRLVYSPPEDTPPIYHFVNLPQVEGVPSAMPEAYDDLTSFAAAPVNSYVIPPEINHVFAFCFISPQEGASPVLFPAHRYNPKSYRVPVMTVDPDPDSPHYIGHERLRLMPSQDWVVAGESADSYRQTVLAVNFLARRVLNFAGRGIRIQPLRAPLVALKDPVTDRLRTLRFGDSVTWRGQSGWFIRSVNPEYDLDTCQMADYELFRLEPL